MHPLHDYVARQLAGKIRSRQVVVWYDENNEFQLFVNEVRGCPRKSSESVAISINGENVRLAEYAGSMLELRTTVEQYVSGDSPAAMVVYIPGCLRDRRASLLMELEKAGITWEPQLKQLAKNVLLQKYTLGVVDEMLPFDREVSYDDLARAVAGNAGAEPPSILKSIFHDTSGNDAILASWLVSEARDAEIGKKKAAPELAKLVKARLGLDLPNDATLGKIRAVTIRYLLASEFRLDLSCDAPAPLAGVSKPTTKAEEAAIRELARRLRSSFPEAYASLADRVEGELGLKTVKLFPEALGAIDTFRFEERALLMYAGDLIASGKFDEAVALITEREHSFWLDHDVGRKAQWEATRRMADLGKAAATVRSSVSNAGTDATAWFEGYSATNGWFRLDQAQRKLEAWIANLDEDPDGRVLGVVRRTYEDVCHLMAVGFTKALVKANWSLPTLMHQTEVYTDHVATKTSPVAYFFVDAMRYEMGVELMERLPKTAEVNIRAAVGALPSITPIGMAALHPGAGSSFSVVEEKGKLGVRIGDAFLPDLPARKKLAAAQVPKSVDIALDDLLTNNQPAKLAKKLAGAPLVIVRSQEIDHAGEAGFNRQARKIMDAAIDDIARAIRKLAAAGVEQSVITADHGHLFFASDRDESMRVESPGGDQVDLHRRCWIGRGGTTPPGCVRVSAAALGYESDLEFVFPAGSGVFRAGGDLSFHHGGPSLQEIVIPVVSVRMAGPAGVRTASDPITVSNAPALISNRIFSVTIQMGGSDRALIPTDMAVRPVLLSAGKHVGCVGMAVDTELDRATGCVNVRPGAPVTVAFLLNDDSVRSIRIVVQDPLTDAELYRSPAEIPVKLGV